jgi:hypothetical protein
VRAEWEAIGVNLLESLDDPCVQSTEDTDSGQEMYFLRTDTFCTYKSAGLLILCDVDGVVQLIQMILFPPIFGIFKLLEGFLGSKSSCSKISSVKSFSFYTIDKK